MIEILIGSACLLVAYELISLARCVIGAIWEEIAGQPQLPQRFL
jgi:hypothetical protein